MLSLKRLTESRAALNAAASYFAFFSTAAYGFLSIPLVVRYLDKEEIGLWAIVSQAVGYLLWMDLGIGVAAGRKLAEAVANEDRIELDSWWTTICTALTVLGLLLLIVGMALIPGFIHFFNVPPHLIGDAWILFSAAILSNSLNFPIKGVAGLLVTQERFHWSPIAQGIQPWIMLAAFYTGLKMGLGIRSYAVSILAMTAFSWIYYYFIVKSSKLPPRLTLSRLEWPRLRSLLGFSTKLTAVQIADSIIQSLPVILLSRTGAIGQIPIYTFSMRGPDMLTSLVRRTIHAFYPRLQKLHVSRDHHTFHKHFLHVCHLTFAISLIAAGLGLCFNRSLVELLAGKDFFAGSTTNLWFCLIIISTQLLAITNTLLQIGGDLGKIALVSIIKLAIAVGSAFLLFRTFGLPGLAATFALIPLIQAAYASKRGGIACHFDKGTLLRSIGIPALYAATLIATAGTWIAICATPGPEISLLNHSFALPGIVESIAGLSLVALGTPVAVVIIRKIAYKHDN